MFGTEQACRPTLTMSVDGDRADLAFAASPKPNVGRKRRALPHVPNVFDLAPAQRPAGTVRLSSGLKRNPADVFSVQHFICFTRGNTIKTRTPTRSVRACKSRAGVIQ